MRSAVIAEDGSRLVYGVPYGKRVYYGVTPAGAALRFSGAPMRGPYWVRRMLAEEAEDLCRAVSEVILNDG
jgi:hypothetical protein